MEMEPVVRKLRSKDAVSGAEDATACTRSMKRTPESFPLEGRGHGPGRMVRVEQLVGQVRHGPFEILPIKSLNRRILMGEPQIVALIQTVEHLPSGACQLLGLVDGLTAAPGTAAGTGHHFHELILHLA